MNEPRLVFSTFSPVSFSLSLSRLRDNDYNNLLGTENCSLVQVYTISMSPRKDHHFSRVSISSESFVFLGPLVVTSFGTLCRNIIICASDSPAQPMRADISVGKCAIGAQKVETEPDRGAMHPAQTSMAGRKTSCTSRSRN